MNIRHCGWAIGLFISLVIVTGCASHTQYRTNPAVCPGQGAECDTYAIHPFGNPSNPAYLLSFIEFDDQGHLWDRKQLNAITEHLSHEVNSRDLIMVVYAHGWKHSAKPGDLNTDRFREVLAKLAEDEKVVSEKSCKLKETCKPARLIAGVYLGWRGGSVPIPVVENLTFWERKNTAAKVGHGDVTEVLSRLEQLRKDHESTCPTDQTQCSDTRLVIVGHSFGGLVVHTALNQILGSRFVSTTAPAGTQGDVGYFGNLVVLINPAFEAQQFSGLSDISAERGTYFPSQLPVMAILTSEADYATRYSFNAGRRLSTVFEKTRDYSRKNAVTGSMESISEYQANVTAVGHFDPFRTHNLYPTQKMPGADKIYSLSGNESVQSALNASARWERDVPGSMINFGSLTLERTSSSAGRNPFLVIRVDKDLIKNHGDISDERIVDFLRQLVLINTTNAAQRKELNKAFGIPEIQE